VKQAILCKCKIIEASDEGDLPSNKQNACKADHPQHTLYACEGDHCKDHQPTGSPELSVDTKGHTMNQPLLVGTMGPRNSEGVPTKDHQHESWAFSTEDHLNTMTSCSDQNQACH